MWIERLEIDGFKRLEGTFTLSRTLTVVVGDNEAGKSSLHESLIRALFGFSRGERRRSRGSSIMERGAPWDGRPYRLVATIRREDRQWRIEWNFADYGVRVIDDLGNDITADVQGRRDDVELGEHLLGVDIDDFRQVCCIDQQELSAVRQSPSLGVALQEAVANVAGDMPVEHAVDRLNDFLRPRSARE